MKLQNYFQDPSSLHIGTEPLRAYYVPCKEEAEANDADMLNASRAIVLKGDDCKFKFYESNHQAAGRFLGMIIISIPMYAIRFLSIRHMYRITTRLVCM